MSEYAWIRLNKQILNMPPVLNILKFWIYQSSEYDRVLNMQVLYSVLNMPEYALT